MPQLDTQFFMFFDWSNKYKCDSEIREGKLGGKGLLNTIPHSFCALWGTIEMGKLTTEQLCVVFLCLGILEQHDGWARSSQRRPRRKLSWTGTQKKRHWNFSRALGFFHGYIVHKIPANQPLHASGIQARYIPFQATRWKLSRVRWLVDFFANKFTH